MHALEPLVYAFGPDQVVLLSEPAVFLGALWIPYRRSPSLMKSILQAGRARPDVSMIYCHADIRGAFMNDGMRSRDGLEVSDFPPHMPIYTGHFHKPHTVHNKLQIPYLRIESEFYIYSTFHCPFPGIFFSIDFKPLEQMKKADSKVRYVGSPYQTSLSEAGQEKYLYCMECTLVESQAGTPHQEKQQYEWKEVERWPLNVGKKYWKVSLNPQKEDLVLCDRNKCT